VTGRVAGDESGDVLPAGGLQMWVDRRGTGWAPLPWLEPEPAHVEAAGKLVDRYLLQPAAALEAAVCGAAVAEDAVAHKQHCQSLISGLSAILMGLMGRLEDFEGMPGNSQSGGVGSSEGVPLYPVGRTGASVGRPGARSSAAAALARVIRCALLLGWGWGGVGCTGGLTRTCILRGHTPANPLNTTPTHNRPTDRPPPKASAQRRGP